MAQVASFQLECKSKEEKERKNRLADMHRMGKATPRMTLAQAVSNLALQNERNRLLTTSIRVIPHHRQSRRSRRQAKSKGAC
jgi:hypothetical protein